MHLYSACLPSQQSKALQWLISPFTRTLTPFWINPVTIWLRDGHFTSRVMPPPMDTLIVITVLDDWHLTKIQTVTDQNDIIMGVVIMWNITLTIISPIYNWGWTMIRHVLKTSVWACECYLQSNIFSSSVRVMLPLFGVWWVGSFTTSQEQRCCQCAAVQLNFHWKQIVGCKGLEQVLNICLDKTEAG